MLTIVSSWGMLNVSNERMIPIATSIFERYGFTARISKCKLIGRDAICHGVRYNADPEGHILLGCPVGSPKVRRDTCERILADMI